MTEVQAGATFHGGLDDLQVCQSDVEIVTGNPGVFQLYPYPYPPNPYPWLGVRVLEGKCMGLHGFGGFGGFGKICRLMSLKTYIHICIA